MAGTPQLTRRAFLGGLGALAAAIAVPLVGRQAVTALVHGASHPLRRSTFLPHVGSTFQMRAAGGFQRVVLSEIDDLYSAPAGDENRFALVFEASEPAQPSATYTFRHPRMADVDLLVVPGRSTNPVRYIATINRLP